MKQEEFNVLLALNINGDTTIEGFYFVRRDRFSDIVYSLLGEQGLFPMLNQIEVLSKDDSLFKPCS